MRFLKVGAVLSLSLLTTCMVSEQTYSLPQVAETDKWKAISVEKISFFRDEDFSRPLEESFLAEKSRKEALETLTSELKSSGFRVGNSLPNRINLMVDVGLRNIFFNFFLIARIRGCDGMGREVLEFLTETEVRSGKEEEVRRAGNELARKVAKNLAKIFAPKPQ